MKMEKILKKYVFKAYSKIFPDLFNNEKNRISSQINLPVVIEHIGSTAVPGLGGKGIIDIAIATDRQNIESISKQLQALGYEFRPNFSTPHRHYFITFLSDPEEDKRRYHIHLTYAENEEWKNFLGFIDYLISHPEEAQEYAELKRKAVLEADEDGQRYRTIKEPIFEKINAFINKTNNHPKISIYIAMSIDGYIARKDGSLDWLERGHVGEEDYGFKKFFNSIDALVFGKNTYEVVSAFEKWPYTGKKVIVLSSTLKAVREEVGLFCGQLPDLLSRLHSEGVKHVWIDGGMTVSRFLEAGLVDDITISIIPVILGDGIPLFSVMNNEKICRFISTQAYPSGLVQLKYEVIK